MDNESAVDVSEAVTLGALRSILGGWHSVRLRGHRCLRVIHQFPGVTRSVDEPHCAMDLRPRRCLSAMSNNVSKNF